MRILGIITRTHDSGLAVLDRGVPTMVLEEERFNREKHTRKFPFGSLKAALTLNGHSSRSQRTSTSGLLDRQARVAPQFSSQGLDRTWEALFRSLGMKHPLPRMPMNFNKGWIDFEGGGAEHRTGRIQLEAVLKDLVAQCSRRVSLPHTGTIPQRLHGTPQLHWCRRVIDRSRAE